MSVMRATKPRFDRRGLAIEAIQAATATRAKAKFDQPRPICIYGVCESLGIVVRFNNINMEGMYQRGCRRASISPRGGPCRGAPTIARMNLAITYSATARRLTNYVRTPRQTSGRTQRNFWPTPSPASYSCRSSACAEPSRSEVGLRKWRRQRKSSPSPASLASVTQRF